MSETPKEIAMAPKQITVSVKDTEVFAELLKASIDFFAWYNRTYQTEPSIHPEHPWCRLGEVLVELSQQEDLHE